MDRKELLDALYRTRTAIFDGKEAVIIGFAGLAKEKRDDILNRLYEAFLLWSGDIGKHYARISPSVLSGGAIIITRSLDDEPMGAFIQATLEKNISALSSNTFYRELDKIFHIISMMIAIEERYND